MSSNTCNCCEAPAAATPVALDNRPGLSAIAYRVGRFAEFRQAMFQAISASPELRALSTRRSDDYAITVMELWAAVADVLTFYQERIANESFLRTAVYRDSVLRLARLLGYELGPGIAAIAYLRFSTEPDKQVDIPIGLRVQSVPGQGEKPQKFETLEAITASAWLNGVSILPAPEGVNPLTKGRSCAYLSPGEEGLAIAESITKGDRILLFAPDGGTPLEELTVRELEVDQAHVWLRWERPVQGADWDLESRAYKRVNGYRLFGYNAPDQYPKAEQFAETDESFSILQWSLQEIGTGTPGEDNFAVAADDPTLHLDGRYDALEVGARLLLDESAGQQLLVTVTEVGQEAQTLGPITDTVTRIKVSPPFTQIDDRRDVVLHELAGPEVRFWGYAYPDRLASATVYVPGRRIDAETMEVGREIENDAFKDGETIALTNIEDDRRVLLLDDGGEPVAATINGAEIVGLAVAFEATAADPATVMLLKLDAETGEPVTGLCSALLDDWSGPSNTATTPSLSATIGDIGPITLSLSGTLGTLAQVAAVIQSALRAADDDPAFASARALGIADRLVVLSGTCGADVLLEATDEDETTVVELGLDADGARPVTGLVSGSLPSLPPLTTTTPTLSVAIGPIGPRKIQLGATPASLEALRSDLQSALRAADPAPCFRYALVVIVGSRLLVFPGLLGGSRQDYLALSLKADFTPFMKRSSAILAGNIALASHGETVADEVLGDADPTVAFQTFALKKSPITFVPSAAESGAESSLSVSVNGVQWQEVASLYGQGPNQTVYATRIDDEGEAEVAFGDGVTGARPAAGRANVIANYRQGLGLDGQVGAGSLTTLLDRPKGLKSVTNPAAAEGGADSETMDEARDNAPNTVRTFGRAVSLRDLEDLVRATGEVAKACATWVWDGGARAAHLTVAGQNGTTFSASSLARIHASLNAQRDANRKLLLDNYVQRPIIIAATLKVDAAYVAEDVAEVAYAALLDSLSFEALAFGRPVHLSDVYRQLQDVPGVVSVDVDRLFFKQGADETGAEFEAFLDQRGVTRTEDGTAKPVQGHLRVLSARPNPDSGPPVLSAEQAWIESPTQDITLLTSGGLPS